MNSTQGTQKVQIIKKLWSINYHCESHAHLTQVIIHICTRTPSYIQASIRISIQTGARIMHTHEHSEKPKSSQAHSHGESHKIGHGGHTDNWFLAPSQIDNWFLAPRQIDNWFLAPRQIDNWFLAPRQINNRFLASSQRWRLYQGNTVEGIMTGHHKR